MYNTAIIGIGEIGYKMDKDHSRKLIWTHAKTYITHSKTIFKAACDIDRANYADFKLSYPETVLYNSVSTMFDNESIDILSICTPTQSHLEIVKQVVSTASIKAIFIEKPMGKNLKEAEEIVKLCKDSGTILAVNYMRRWENKYRSIKKLIDDNIMGDLYSLTAYGSTALLTSTSHLIDIFLYYGGDIAWLIGKLQKDYVRKVHGVSDEGGCAFVKFKNGVFGFLKGISKNPYNYMFEIDIIGSKVRINISEPGEIKCSTWMIEKNPEFNTNGYKGFYSHILKNRFVNVPSERMINAISDIISASFFCIN